MVESPPQNFDINSQSKNVPLGTGSATIATEKVAALMKVEPSGEDDIHHS